MTIGSVVVPALLAGFEAFSAGISAVMSAIQGFFQGLITFITGVFSGSWSQAWEGIKQIFGSAFDGLVALCKAPLNAVIAIINKAISGINGLGLTIPEWAAHTWRQELFRQYTHLAHAGKGRLYGRCFYRR